MKLGDITICKCDIIIWDIKEFKFYSNKYYLITDIYSYSIKGDSYIQLWNEEYKDFCNMSKSKFEKYFITIKDVRKMKLEQINQNLNLKNK